MPQQDPKRRTPKADVEYIVSLVVLGALLVWIAWMLYT